MTQRDVTDQNATTWACVQAYASGLNDKQTEKAATKLAENEEGLVPVVCTPGGGAQSVRLQLTKDWLQQVSDEELLAKIAAAQNKN